MSGTRCNVSSSIFSDKRSSTTRRISRTISSSTRHLTRRRAGSRTNPRTNPCTGTSRRGSSGPWSISKTGRPRGASVPIAGSLGARATQRRAPTRRVEFRAMSLAEVNPQQSDWSWGQSLEVRGERWKGRQTYRRPRDGQVHWRLEFVLHSLREGIISSVEEWSWS
jgi:hypothetical protein